MIDNLEEHDPTLFTRTDSTFIDLYMKSGMYITEVVKKLFHHTRKHYSSDEACLKHILENQVYGLSPTPILQGITQSYIFGFDREQNISRKNFIQHDLTPEAQENKAKEKLQELYNLNKDMKFDAVVGNPPFQEDSGTSARDEAIYNYFYDFAEKVADKYCLISPARFLFNAGSTNKKWNQKMLQDKHIKVEYYEQNSSVVFPNTDIKGGVAILYRDAQKDFGAIGAFTSYKELHSILHKVENKKDFKSLDSYITGRGIYRLTELVHQEFSEIENLQSKGHKNDVGSGAFKILSNVIFFDNKPIDNHEYIQVLGLENMQRVYKYIRRDFINKPIGFEKYKVILPKANGSGVIGEVLSTPLIGEPLIGFTETFISIGAFDNEQEAQNCLKYIKSKFARTMLGVLKITQDNPRDKWQKVPLQDFTPNSDIDWTKSISEIDQQLYKKYGLSEEEIAFIEEKVQAME